jgi:DNA adenine methylase
MLDIKPFSLYNGGKNGNGVYQTIINHIPPHEVYMSLFLGNCAITRYIKPAKLNVLNDLDKRVYDAWNEALPFDYMLYNRDAVNILKEFIVGKEWDNPNVFIYLDPPYLMDTRKSDNRLYKHEMTKEDHVDLLSQLNSILQAKIMISSYPNDIYDKALAGWSTYDFYSTTRNGVALERIYYNYKLTDQRHDYSYLGGNFRERERNTRIIKNMARKLERLDPELRNAVIEMIINKTK